MCVCGSNHQSTRQVVVRCDQCCQSPTSLFWDHCVQSIEPRATGSRVVTPQTTTSSGSIHPPPLTPRHSPSNHHTSTHNQAHTRTQAASQAGKRVGRQARWRPPPPPPISTPSSPSRSGRAPGPCCPVRACFMPPWMHAWHACRSIDRMPIRIDRSIGRWIGWHMARVGRGWRGG